MTMDTYTMEFDKLYNKTKKFAMVLPESVKAFKLLEGAGLEQKHRQLVLTSVNYENSDTLYKQMTSALKKSTLEDSHWQAVLFQVPPPVSKLNHHT